MIACASARVEYSAEPATASPPSEDATRAAAAASGDATSWRDDTSRAYSTVGTISAYRPAVAGRPAICA